MPKDKNQGLRLTLGGAPEAPMTLAGVPGVYRPNRAVPVGGPGELSVEAAQAFADDKNVPLELVDIPDKDVDQLREQARQDVMEARGGLQDNTRGQRLARNEMDRLNDQASSLTLPKEA